MESSSSSGRRLNARHKTSLACLAAIVATLGGAVLHGRVPPAQKPSAPVNLRVMYVTFSSVRASAVTASSATITWTTDKPGTSRVDYGPTPAGGTSTPLDAALVTSHAVALTGLNAGTRYYFRVLSSDQAGRVSRSARYEFTTGAAPDTTPPSVSMTAPLANATVSGTVSLFAAASDNVGVVGVQFRQNGVAVGAEDVIPPYSAFWDTTAAPDGTYAVTAVARDAAGNQRVSPPVSLTVANSPPPPPSTEWTNEPVGFTVVEDTGWESGSLGSWYRIFTSADKPIGVSTIPDSPLGESRALQIDFPAGHSGGGGTELRYDIPSAQRSTEIYVGYYVQVSPNWQGHSSAINKMLYLHDGGGSFSAMWYEMFGSDSSPLGLYVVNQSGSSPSGIHENVVPVTFARGLWHKVEIYQKQGDANNGIVRVWVNGVLAIDRSDVDTRSAPIDNVTLSGIWGGVGDSKDHADYMRFDRIRISRR
jgi:hypothetical protein